MIARALAFFAGLFTLLNLGGDLIWPGFDASAWWIGIGALPRWLARSVLAGFAIAMLAFALRKRAPARPAYLTVAMALLFAVFAGIDCVRFSSLAAKGSIAAGLPVPLSLVVFAGLLLIAWSAWKQSSMQEHDRRWTVAGGVGLLAAFPLFLMLFFGNTDYRRPADVAVVFGARVYANGVMSDALKDRIRTACELYRAGLAKRLVLSGGRGDGPVTEASAMRTYALAHGVDSSDIVIDDLGVNSEATVRDTMPMFQKWGARRVLVVSHFYHLPRIKLAYCRAGMDVFTVPARQERILARLPMNMAREVIAFWAYYFRDRPSHLQDAPRVASL